MEENTTKQIPTYAKITGIIALILAISSIFIPIIGALLIVPLAIIFGIISLIGGNKKLGLIVLIIVSVKLIISPTFWINLVAGFMESDAVGNRVISYLDIFGIIFMTYLYAKKDKHKLTIKKINNVNIAGSKEGKNNNSKLFILLGLLSIGLFLLIAYIYINA